jgi:starch phosphorylase
MNHPEGIQLRTSNEFAIPERLNQLIDLAYNLRWSWDEDTQKVFERVSPAVWRRTKNPVMVLNAVHDYSTLLADPGFLKDFDTAVAGLKSYTGEAVQTWYCQKTSKASSNASHIAYFCAEYGIHESFPGYSGGLGILAGDHCKAASDMDLPFSAVGLLYRNGYFRQVIDPDGRQEHNYPEFVTTDLPIYRVQSRSNGEDLFIDVEIADRRVSCAIWLAQVGRISLYLLDTNTDRNSPEDREITRLLYVRGREMRLAQEIVLGVGGVRALAAMGVSPATWHLNEGHSAFMIVERLGQLMSKKKISLADAADEISRSSVFTIHTPVPAGNEVFGADLVRSFAAPIFEKYGITSDDILSKGLGIEGNAGAFDMTAFCLRMASLCNGVSLLHGNTAHDTWHKITGRSISGVTNGVHMGTWLGNEVRHMLANFGLDLATIDLKATDIQSAQALIDKQIGNIPSEVFWKAHSQQKQISGDVLKGRLRNQLARNGHDPQSITAKIAPFKRDVLTIGFARRFATYKRAALLFTDPKRLHKIVDNPEKPVQLLFAGKAHPADKPGQALILDIISKTQKYKLEDRVFFIEDYDMETGRALVQGVDIWLNNPRRPLEASGTSGMKAAANGIPNVSILDGWWDEGFTGDNGWAIGTREQLDNETLQDKKDAESLYALLEGVVTETYYKTGTAGYSEEWVQVMKRAMATSLLQFSTTRMLSDYYEQMYSKGLI